MRPALHERGVSRRFERGAALFHERQLSDRVMLLLEGRVKIASASEDGREAVLAFRGPGEVLGELSAIDGQPRSASVTAVDPVWCAGGARRRLPPLPRAHPARDAVAAHPGDRACARPTASASSSARRTRSGAWPRGSSSWPSATAGRPSNGIRIDLPITQEELASWVGSSREGVNKALHTLRGLHWVETRAALDHRDRLRGAAAPRRLATCPG